MRNYYKAIVGSISSTNLQSAILGFDDGDASDARAALHQAREALGGTAVVSVWHRARTVPGYVPVIGEPVDVLHPGEPGGH